MKLILTVLLAMLLTSCSSVELTFFFADRFIASRVGKSFNLNSKQEGMLRQQIKSDLNSNKLKIGQKLDLFFLKIETLAMSDAVSFDEFSKFDKMLMDFRSSLVMILKPSIDQFVKTTKKSNYEKFGQDYEKDVATEEKKVSGLETFVEFFLGSVTKQQTQLFKDFISSNSDFYKLQLNNRKDFSLKIVEKLTSEEKSNFIVLYMTGDTSVREPEYVTQHTLYKQRAMKMWFEFWKTMTADQRKVLIKNLQKYRKQVQETFLGSV